MKAVQGQKNRMKSRDMRGDNRGMSLLEMIIAVAIFSIAAMSLLGSFVTSSRINKKSNLYLEASTLASSMMEEVKAKSFTDLAAAFNYPTDVSGSSRFSFLTNEEANQSKNIVGISEVLNNNGKYEAVRKYSQSNDEDTSNVTASVISKNDGSTYTLNSRTSGTNASKYYFEMTGVKVVSETFDLLVEFDASSDTTYKKDNQFAEDEKNDYEMPNIAKLSTTTNGFLSLPADFGEDIAEDWKTVNDLSAVEVEDIVKDMKRTITIRLSQNGSVVTAEAAYSYEYTHGEETYTYPDTKNGEKESYIAFFSTEVGSELEGLYVFYYPNYNSTTGNVLDNFVFDNTLGEDLNFFLVKQQSDDTTSANEQNYRMSLTVKEIPTKSNWSTNPGIYDAQTVLRSNLNYDISDSSTDSSSRKKTTQKQMTLTYQAMSKNADGTLVEGTSRSGSSAESILNLNGLDNKEAEDRIYTVKVSVYKTGAAANNFPDDDLVATLDGAKED